MNREEAIEAGVRAIHAEECCPDWPSAYCDGPSPRDRTMLAVGLDAVGWRPESEIAAETLHAAANALTDDAVRWGASPRRDRYSTAAWLIDRAAALAGEA